MCTAASASRTCRAPRSQSEYTATVERPISRQARMIRTAISPRLAISTLTARRPGALSQRDVPVLLRRIAVAFGLEAGERGDQLRARLAGWDHFVDEAARRRDVRVRELLAELRDALGPQRVGIRGSVELALVEDVHRALGPHHRDFRGGPREVHVGPDVLARHDAVRAA